MRLSGADCFAEVPSPTATDARAHEVHVGHEHKQTGNPDLKMY